MPKLRKVNAKDQPKGWEIVEPTLSELQEKIKEINSTEGVINKESLWMIMRFHHQMSRYIFDLYYYKKAISKDLYDYCLKERWADKNLISKWKKTGYEKLCCLLCIQTRNQNQGTTCICRVPKKHLEEDKIIECHHCGCRGCVSYDLEK